MLTARRAVGGGRRGTPHVLYGSFRCALFCAPGEAPCRVPPSEASPQCSRHSSLPAAGAETPRRPGPAGARRAGGGDRHRPARRHPRELDRGAGATGYVVAWGPGATLDRRHHRLTVDVAARPGRARGCPAASPGPPRSRTASPAASQVRGRRTVSVVTLSAVSSFAFQPATLVLEPGQSTTVAVVARFEDATSEDVSAAAQWTVEGTASVTVGTPSGRRDAGGGLRGEPSWAPSGRATRRASASASGDRAISSRSPPRARVLEPRNLDGRRGPDRPRRRRRDLRGSRRTRRAAGGHLPGVALDVRRRRLVPRRGLLREEGGELRPGRAPRRWPVGPDGRRSRSRSRSPRPRWRRAGSSSRRPRRVGRGGPRLERQPEQQPSRRDLRGEHRLLARSARRRASTSAPRARGTSTSPASAPATTAGPNGTLHLLCLRTGTGPDAARLRDDRQANLRLAGDRGREPLRLAGGGCCHRRGGGRRALQVMGDRGRASERRHLPGVALRLDEPRLGADRERWPLGPRGRTCSSRAIAPTSSRNASSPRLWRTSTGRHVAVSREAFTALDAESAADTCADWTDVTAARAPGPPTNGIPGPRLLLAVQLRGIARLRGGVSGGDRFYVN